MRVEDEDRESECIRGSEEARKERDRIDIPPFAPVAEIVSNDSPLYKSPSLHAPNIQVTVSITKHTTPHGTVKHARPIHLKLLRNLILRQPLLVPVL